VAIHGEIRWPPTGLSMAAYGEIPTAAVRRSASSRTRGPERTSHPACQTVTCIPAEAPPPRSPR
jgi:hypothetical protein